MDNEKGWIALFWSMIGLGILAVIFNTGKVEADLTGRVNEALHNNGYEWASVKDSSGRNLVLVGQSPVQAAQDGAVEIARKTYGVRCIDNETSVREPVSPYAWSATVNQSEIILAGVAPDKATQALVMEKAGEVAAGRKIVNKMSLADGAPEDGWAENIDFALSQAKGLKNGAVHLVDREVRIEGTSWNSADAEKLSTADTAPAGYKLTTSVKSPAQLVADDKAEEAKPEDADAADTAKAEPAAKADEKAEKPADDEGSKSADAPKGDDKNAAPVKPASGDDAAPEGDKPATFAAKPAEEKTAKADGADAKADGAKTGDANSADAADDAPKTATAEADDGEETKTAKVTTDASAKDEEASGKVEDGEEKGEAAEAKDGDSAADDKSGKTEVAGKDQSEAKAGDGASKPGFFSKAISAIKSMGSDDKKAVGAQPEAKTAEADKASEDGKDGEGVKSADDAPAATKPEQTAEAAPKPGVADGSSATDTGALAEKADEASTTAKIAESAPTTAPPAQPENGNAKSAGGGDHVGNGLTPPQMPGQETPSAGPAAPNAGWGYAPPPVMVGPAWAGPAWGAPGWGGPYYGPGYYRPYPPCPWGPAFCGPVW